MRAIQYINRIDSLIDAMDSASSESDPIELNGTEDCDPEVAKIALESLREAIIEESKVQEQLEKSRARIRYYENALAEKRDALEKMRKDLEEFKLKSDEEIAKILEHLNGFRDELLRKQQQLDTCKKLFDRFNVCHLPGQFCEGAIERLKSHVQLARDKGFKSGVIFLSTEYNKDAIAQIIDPHVDGVPVRFFDGIKPDQYIFYYQHETSKS